MTVEVIPVTNKTVDKMLAIIDKKKYKPFYIVGAKYKLFYFLYRVFPHSWFIAITRKTFS